MNLNRITHVPLLENEILQAAIILQEHPLLAFVRDRLRFLFTQRILEHVGGGESTTYHLGGGQERNSALECQQF
jgi:hypothetical protein